MTRAEADPPPGAVDAEEPVSLLLSAFELLFLRWIMHLNLKTIPDYTTVTTLVLLLAHEEEQYTKYKNPKPLSFSGSTFFQPPQHNNYQTQTAYASAQSPYTLCP
jgi:hypothetical protein